MTGAPFVIFMLYQMLRNCPVAAPDLFSPPCFSWPHSFKMGVIKSERIPGWAQPCTFRWKRLILCGFLTMRGSCRGHFTESLLWSVGGQCRTKKEQRVYKQCCRSICWIPLIPSSWHEFFKKKKEEEKRKKKKKFHVPAQRSTNGLWTLSES